MFFILLVLLSAFLIEGIGTYVSVVGLSALFAANPIIIVLAVALDLGKVVGVSFLYKYAKKVNVIMRTYMTVACITLMFITSTGAFGYLSREFQKAVQGTTQDTIMVTALEDEQTRLQHRKVEIDTQIAKLPDNFVRGRKQLIQQFAPEQERITGRLAEIDKQLPQLKIDSIKKNTDVGPIIYVAQAFGTDPEHAVKWVIMIIIFVFDPLAIALLLAGNFLIDEREKKKLLPSPVTPLDDEHFEKEAQLAAMTPIEEPEMPPLPEQFTIPHAIAPLRANVMMHLEDDQLHRQLGRERYVEHPAEQLDHLTHADLGRQKPVDPEPEQSPAPVAEQST